MSTVDPQILDLATENGLLLEPSSVAVNEMGLDFRVALATTASATAASSAGERWVLRIPRRPDAMDRAGTEGQLLAAIRPHLDTAVPDWRIHTPGLIAYPALPGEPGLTLDGSGAPTWHLDIASERYARSLGAFLAQLHAIDPAEVAGAGVEVLTPDAVRQRWRRDIERVAAEFTVAQPLAERWNAWVAEDSYWPEFSVLTHGEVYPAHTLVRDEEITAVLDWTTAEVGDPAKDFAFHHSAAPSEAFGAVVDEYVRRGGRVWPRLPEHCAEIIAASPVEYGLYALHTGADEHRQAAQELLDPVPA